jgi:hypothetical protein
MKLQKLQRLRIEGPPQKKVDLPRLVLPMATSGLDSQLANKKAFLAQKRTRPLIIHPKLLSNSPHLRQVTLDPAE